MWNAIWVTAETDRLQQVIQHLRKNGILVKRRMFFDDDRCFFEVLVPAAETGIALDILAEM